MLGIEFGTKGTILKTGGTATATGNFYALAAITDATIEIAVNWTNAGATETFDILAGQVIYGVITSATVTAGTVVAYE